MTLEQYSHCPELEHSRVYVEELKVSGVIISAVRVGRREAEIVITVNNSNHRYVLRRHIGKIKRWIREAK